MAGPTTAARTMPTVEPRHPPQLPNHAVSPLLTRDGVPMCRCYEYGKGPINRAMEEASIAGYRASSRVLVCPGWTATWTGPHSVIQRFSEWRRLTVADGPPSRSVSQLRHAHDQQRRGMEIVSRRHPRPRRDGHHHGVYYYSPWSGTVTPSNTRPTSSPPRARAPEPVEDSVVLTCLLPPLTGLSSDRPRTVRRSQRCGRC